MIATHVTDRLIKVSRGNAYCGEMILLGFYLLSLFSQMVLAESFSRRPRLEGVKESFRLAEGPKSQLFSQCVADAMSVAGSLYSIQTGADEKYVLFAPRVEIEMDWTDVDLTEPNILSCALKASELAFSVLGSVAVAVGKNYGCYASTSAGMTYGDGNQRLVAETELPEPDKCCSQAGEGYCVVATCAEERIGHCEAKARCEAKGYALASKSLFENPARIPPYQELTDKGLYFFWIDAKLDDEGVWRWSDGSEFRNVTWSATPIAGEDCAVLDLLSQSFGRVRVSPVSCWSNFQWCALCYDPDTSFPVCP